jgi:dTDP-4-dehydrorhamnose 3,5-epimerase
VIFHALPLSGAFLVELDKKGDERGFFARFFCSREYEETGLEATFQQVNTSVSRDIGTLRGLHYQVPPSAEVKVVRVIHGALWDVIVDVRSNSATFGRSYGARLDADNRTMMYVPKGFAHGFVTLEPDTEVLYLVSTPYSPIHENGLRWDDPALAIEWPITPSVISDKDKSWQPLSVSHHGVIISEE